jgi:hypothetical protein
MFNEEGSYSCDKPLNPSVTKESNGGVNTKATKARHFKDSDETARFYSR